MRQKEAPWYTQLKAMELLLFIVLPIPRINLLQESPVSCPCPLPAGYGRRTSFRSDAQFRQHIRLTNQVAFSLRKLPQRILVSRGSCL